MAVLAFPAAERYRITQLRLRDLKQRMAEHEELGRRIAELSAEMLNELSDGATVQNGPLTARIAMLHVGSEAIVKLVIEVTNVRAPYKTLEL